MGSANREGNVTVGDARQVRWRLVALVTAAAAALVADPAPAAFAAASSPTASAAPSALSLSAGALGSPLTSDQAAELAAEVRSGTASLKQANDQLDTLRTQANEALAAHAEARKTADAAQLAARTAKTEADAVAGEAGEAQGALDQMAADAYRGGPLAGRNPGIGALLAADNPDDLVRTVHDAQTVTAHQSSTVTELNAALDAKQRAAAKAASTASAAEDAERAEQTAKRRADQLMAAARQLVAAVATDLAGKGTADQLAQALTVAEKRERDHELQRAGALKAGQPVLGTGGCNGSDVSAYPNGQIPLSALCPLWAAPGQLLRADAARAFTAMSRAYAEAVGQPLCVTDSYRSLAIQQDLIKRKPTLAAIPGTSNHGWAKAVDMCGGVENFGTAAHRWMDENAFRFGWFHPAWAEPTGNRPEPWHWEYGGS